MRDEFSRFVICTIIRTTFGDHDEAHNVAPRHGSTAQDVNVSYSPKSRYSCIIRFARCYGFSAIDLILHPHIGGSHAALSGTTR